MCGHCHQELSKTLFFQHQKLYYDKQAQEWSSERITTVDLGDDFDFTEAEGRETRTSSELELITFAL